MSTTTMRRRACTAALLGALGFLAACASTGTRGGGRLSPVRERITDEVIDRDLATMAEYERRIDALAPPAGARKYVATRAKEYLALAREAYERNDRSSFAEDALGWAVADLETLERGGEAGVISTQAPMPAGARERNAELWARAERLRRDPAALGAPDEVARAEALLIRAAHAFLAGPACVVDPVVPDASRRLDIAERSQVVPERPAPVAVEPQPLPPRPRDCSAPERLEGVPTIVHFALDKSFLAPATREVLDRIVETLAPYPGMHVVLTGHTDPRASNAYNQALSERRVNAVRDYLRSRGMKDEQIETRAVGEERPIVVGESIRDHARNRRVDIVFTLCDGSEIVPVEAVSDLQLEAARRRRAAAREKD